MDNLIRESIYWLQNHTSAEGLTVWLFLLCAFAILALMKFYGLYGLYIYNTLAIIIANIQVLRFTTYSSFIDPVALGTVLFTTTYFVNDVITEHYGLAAAKKCVTLVFWAQLLVTIWMLLALGHPLPGLENASATIKEANISYEAMLQLFTPSSRILLASLASYLLSQWLDILIFNRLRTATNGQFLWFRQNAAMLISGLLDTFLFSFLAFMWLSEINMSWHELFFTYVFSSQILRFILNVAITPFMYLSKYCVQTRTTI